MNLMDFYLQVNRYPWIAFQLHKFLWYAIWTDLTEFLNSQENYKILKVSSVVNLFLVSSISSAQISLHFWNNN